MNCQGYAQALYEKISISYPLLLANKENNKREAQPNSSAATTNASERHDQMSMHTSLVSTTQAMTTNPLHVLLLESSFWGFTLVGQLGKYVSLKYASWEVFRWMLNLQFMGVKRHDLVRWGCWWWRFVTDASTIFGVCVGKQDSSWNCILEEVPDSRVGDRAGTCERK